MTDTTTQVSKGACWTGYIMSALPALLMIFSGVMKLIQPGSMSQDMAKMGLSSSALFHLGFVELGVTLVYLIPSTSVLGAILLTGYLGGATFANVQQGGPLFIIPVIVGVLFWGGIFMRDPRIRALIPIRRGT